jgi:hypothetical protein
MSAVVGNQTMISLAHPPILGAILALISESECRKLKPTNIPGRFALLICNLENLMQKRKYE